ETDPSGEPKVRAYADEHPPPPLVVDIEVVLHNPTVRYLQMATVRLLVADCRHDPRGFSRLQDNDDLIRPCALKVGVDKFVAPALWGVDDRGVPLAGLFLNPNLNRFGTTAQTIAAHRIEVPLTVKKADHSL